MKYWRGYLTAAIFAAFSWAMMQFGEKYQMLVGMVYPYVTKTFQGVLTQWTSGVDFLVWQTIILVFFVLVIASLILYLVWKGNIIQWLGWVLAVVSIVFCLHTGVYGLNYYSDPITQDLRIEQTDYIRSELEAATVYYRDKAGELAVQLPRDEKGGAVFSDFDKLAEQTGNGFRHLVIEKSFSIFGGDYTPVKKLSPSGKYTAFGITGITVPLTGESAVNPDIPGVALPFTMAREMAHRLCIARQEDAKFAAFLACEANESVEYRYSGYFMAYQACYNALHSVDPVSAEKINEGCAKELTWDLNIYNQFASGKKNDTATRLVDTATDAYHKTSTGSDRPEVMLCDLLVNWHLNQYVVEEEPEVKFDPYDETQVDLTGIVNAKPAAAEG